MVGLNMKVSVKTDLPEKSNLKLAAFAASIRFH